MLPGQVHNLRENARVMDKQLNENHDEVRRIDRVADTCEFIHTGFHGLLCRLSRQRSADDFRASLQLKEAASQALGGRGSNRV